MEILSSCAGRRRPAASKRRGRLLAYGILFFVSMAWYGLASPVLAASAPGKVQIVNQTGADIWVGFWSAPPASIVTWGSGCQPISKSTVKVLKTTTCLATVTSTNAASRFCASKSAGNLDCSMAQQNHQTLIETNFQPNCFSTNSSCIWYDISVIPFNPVPPHYGYCTDCTWNGNAKDPTCKPRPWNAQSYCARTGPVAYNLPVRLSCTKQPTYMCRGPLSTKGPGVITYGQAYPSNCGNPNATCACGTPGCSKTNCAAAYFYPMFYPPENKYQPNAVCPSGQTLTMGFLSGP
jgi:hypothetical protein